MAMAVATASLTVKSVLPSNSPRVALIELDPGATALASPLLPAKSLICNTVVLSDSQATWSVMSRVKTPEKSPTARN
jgi:hypothetical protein